LKQAAAAQLARSERTGRQTALQIQVNHDALQDQAIDEVLVGRQRFVARIVRRDHRDATAMLGEVGTAERLAGNRNERLAVRETLARHSCGRLWQSTLGSDGSSSVVAALKSTLNCQCRWWRLSS
jgi:hypothetical protein